MTSWPDKSTRISRRLGICVAFTLLLGLQCWVDIGWGKKKPPIYDDPEGYAVLSLLLSNAGQDIHSPTILINSTSAVEGPDGITSLEKCVKVPEDFREAADDYLQKTKSSYLFLEKFALKAPYRLVSKRPRSFDDLKHPPKSDKEIADRISSGMFILSPVGFDSGHTHAIVRKTYLCGSLCGWGSYHFLVKSAGGWEETKGVTRCSWQF